MPPTYYRGCWHVVSRGFLDRYRHYRPYQQSFTIRRPSSLTRRRWVRVSPIAQYSSLLPPVGVWTVSQFQCGRSTSQSGYRSSVWWAVTLTNCLIGREPILVRISPLVSGRCLPYTLCGISVRFQTLSPSLGQVAHALLTRPPLTQGPKTSRPFDLNVLCTPPAFILSQDQTL